MRLLASCKGSSMKKCSVCKLDLPEEAFSFRKNRKPIASCKKCVSKRTGIYYKKNKIKCLLKMKEYAKAHPEVRAKATKKWYSLHRDLYRALGRRQYQKDKEKIKERARRYNELYPEKTKAHNVVKQLLADGELIKQPCVVCGSASSEAHHPDYSKPTYVVWLCVIHHRELHRRPNESDSRRPT